MSSEKILVLKNYGKVGVLLLGLALNSSSHAFDLKKIAGQVRDKIQDCSENFNNNLNKKVNRLHGGIEKSIQGFNPFKSYICSSSKVKVYSDDFKSITGRVELGDQVKVFQLWNSEHSKVQAKVGGEVVTFKKGEVLINGGASKVVGYIQDDVIRTKGKCPLLNSGQDVDEEEEANESNREEQTYANYGLGEDDCCIFPTTAKPKLNFTTGERRFGAGRSGGRLHAASDLYRNLNDPIRAIQDGVVIQGLRYFYDGTYSLVVRHKGGFIVRYGEVAGRAAPNIREGARVKKGQVIGYAGKLSVRPPMLHFELYNGTKTGALTNGYGSYQRRSDLMNPEDYLLQWLERSF